MERAVDELHLVAEDKKYTWYTYFMHTESHRCLVLSPNVGNIVSVCRTRLNVSVLLTLPLAGESPTCILHEGIHTP